MVIEKLAYHGPFQDFSIPLTARSQFVAMAQRLASPIQEIMSELAARWGNVSNRIPVIVVMTTFLRQQSPCTPACANEQFS